MSRFLWNISRKIVLQLNVDPLALYHYYCLSCCCGLQAQELLNHLDQCKANDVLAVLQRHNINAEKKDQGKTSFQYLSNQRILLPDWLKSTIYRVSLIFKYRRCSCRCLVHPRRHKAIFCYWAVRAISQNYGWHYFFEYMLVNIDNGDSGKDCFTNSFLYLQYEKISTEIKINDIKRFIVNSSASVQYENISVMLSKRRTLLSKHQHMKLANLFLLMIGYASFYLTCINIRSDLLAVMEVWTILTNLVGLKVKWHVRRYESA